MPFFSAMPARISSLVVDQDLDMGPFDIASVKNIVCENNIDCSSLGPIGTLYPIHNYELGDDILIAHDAEATVNLSTYTLAKTIDLAFLNSSPQVLRLEWKDYDDTTIKWGWTRIYKNGVAYSDEFNVVETLETHTVDLSFAQGDSIELWAYSEELPNIIYMSDFRVLGLAHTLLDLSGVSGDIS